MGALETNTTLIYGVHMRESANDGSDFTNAAADYRIAFIGEDGVWHLKDSSGTVTTPGVGAGAITGSGLTMATARLLGRTTASTGAVEEITVGSGLSLSAGALTATGGASYPYVIHRLTATTTNAAVTIDVNSTSYLVFSATAFIFDWDAFPATHFMISCLGQSSAAANTVTMQLTPFADGTNPVSSGGDDIVVTNTFGFFTSGWKAVSDTMAGIDELTLAMKGSSATVDLQHRYIEIHFKKV